MSATHVQMVGFDAARTPTGRALCGTKGSLIFAPDRREATCRRCNPLNLRPNVLTLRGGGVIYLDRASEEAR